MLKILVCVLQKLKRFWIPILQESDNAQQGNETQISRTRQTVLDILAASRSVPAFPLLRDFRLGDIEIARKACATRIGWTAIFLKAYSLVSMEIPELRDRYVRFPQETHLPTPLNRGVDFHPRYDDQGNLD